MKSTQTFSKEAQKCYCGAENCRGFIGGDQSSTKLSASEKIIQPAHSKSKKKDEKRRETDFSDATVSGSRQLYLVPIQLP